MASFEKSTYKDYDKYVAAKKKEKRIRAKRNNDYIKSLETPCLFCGSEDNIHWHHYNPSDKTAEIKKLNHVSFKKIDREVSKCWCLCGECHRKLHRRMVDPLPNCYP